MTFNTPTLEGMPVEVRVKVYAEMSPPINNHVDAYHGIVLANHRFKNEAESELIRNMKAFLESIMKNWSQTYDAPLRINMPTAITAIKHVKIAIPKSVVAADAFQKFPVSFIPLLDLYISTMTIAVYKDGQADDNDLKSLGHCKPPGVLHLLYRIDDMLDEPMHLRCDDGSFHLHKQSFDVDTFTMECHELDAYSTNILRHGVTFQDPKYWKFEYIKVGDKTAGCTWHRL